MSSNFLHDLDIGHSAEALVAKVFEAHGYPVIERAEGKFPDYDIKILDRQGIEKKIEVKWDLQAPDTNNFFFEQKALTHSKADLLIYCYGNPITHLYFLDLPKTLNRLRAIEPNKRGGEQQEFGWLLSKRKFHEILKPKVYEVSSS